MTAAASAIEASGVVVRLGGRPVLTDIDFALSSGELVGLIGPNGAGKTTLARALAGLQPLERGRIAIDGETLGRWPRKALARTLAYLPQAEGVSWDVTVEALVMLGRLPWREPWVAPGADDRDAVERALAATETTGFRNRPASRLSAGERARVLLARALAGEPRILLADEPVANLDPYHQLEVMEHLSGLAAAGTAVLVVLHDLTLASRFCHRLVLLYEGRVAASGPPERVTAPDLLARCFRVRAHHGRLADGPFVVPTGRLRPGDGDAPEAGR